jgi:molybdate transport system substrate-binding protein
VKTAIAVLIVVLVIAWRTASMASEPTHVQATQKPTLTVFAAASLTDAFDEIGEAFEEANGVEIVFNFGSSSTLAAQLAEGAPADVFASANTRQMDVVREAGRIDGQPQPFAKNRLVIAVPADNPGNILSLRDLARPGILLVVAASNVPVRDYTDTMLERLAAAPDFGEQYRQAVLDNIVSEEDNVRQVVAKVALGEADAGIVYQSDITPDIAEEVSAVAIPDGYNSIAAYPIAIIDDAPNPQLAQAFVDYILSDEGQDTLVQWGFISVRSPESLPTDCPPTVPEALSTMIFHPLGPKPTKTAP